MKALVFNTYETYSLPSRVFIIHRIQETFKRLLSILSCTLLKTSLHVLNCKYRCSTYNVSIVCIKLFRERKDPSLWYLTPHQLHRLTEQNITDFVNCVKDYAFISIFNKTYSKKAVIACQYLSMLRPELIVSPIVDKSDILFFGFIVY